MSKKSRADQDAADTENETVGYKRPPRHSQFKPGQSGNPAGRPKKKKKSDTEILDAALNKVVTVKRSGAEVRMTAKEAMLERLVSMALGGDLRAIKLVDSLMEKFGLAVSSEDSVMVAHMPPSAATFNEWLINCGRMRADGTDPSEDRNTP